MNPIQIDHDYLMLRIGRLTVNLEASLTQREQLAGAVRERDAEIERLTTRISELEDLVKILEDDEEDASDDQSEDE